MFSQNQNELSVLSNEEKKQDSQSNNLSETSIFHQNSLENLEVYSPMIDEQEEEEEEEEEERMLLRQMMQEQSDHQSPTSSPTNPTFECGSNDYHDSMQTRNPLSSNLKKKSNRYYRNRTWIKNNYQQYIRRGTPHNTRQFFSVNENYVCHICGEKGHHIRKCPSANDPKHSKKVKPATGLPRSWLVRIPNEDVSRTEANVYSLPDGSFAVLKTNAFVSSSVPLERKIADRYGSLSASTISDEFRCPLCHRLFQDASLMPCCGNTYCRACILVYNKGNNIICPGCQELIHDINEIVLNQTLQESIHAILYSGSQQDEETLVKQTVVPPGTIRKVEPVSGIKPLGGRLIKKRKEISTLETLKKQKTMSNFTTA